jgi:hypothetical protein
MHRTSRRWSPGVLAQYLVQLRPYSRASSEWAPQVLSGLQNLLFTLLRGIIEKFELTSQNLKIEIDLVSKSAPNKK